MMKNVAAKVWLLPLLVAAVLVLPVTACAATSGTCGDNLTWVLDDAGTLTISGTGKINGCDYNEAPWGSGIRTVVIEEGVTGIGVYAFGGCSSLTDVTLPNSLKEISGCAFEDCSSLSNLVIPDSVVYIGPYAFQDCSSLESVTIPKGVTAIYDYTFYDCTSLESVKIPQGVTSIYRCAFSGCSGLTSVTIPDSLTSTAWYAFDRCSNLKEVHINSLDAWLGIKFNANYGHPLSVSDAELYIDGTLLTEVTIPDSITSIPANAFNGCIALTKVTIPDSVTSIGSGAFYGCSGIEEVYTTSLNSWLSISFSGYNSNPLYANSGKLYVNDALLTEAVIPDGVTSLNAYTFAGCGSLQRVTVSEGVTNVGDYAFYNCVSLTNVTICDGVESIGNNSFYGCRTLTGVSIPDSVTSIGSTAFSGCSSLKDVVIPHGVTSINDSTFRNCSALKSVEIQNGVTSIGQFAFDGCNNLTNLTIPDSVTSIAQYAFSSQFASVTLPSGISSFNKYAFYNCHKIGCLFFSGSDRPVYTLSYPLTNSMIYCNEFSEVDFWALENGYKVTYLDSLDANTPLEFSLSVPSNKLWVGERAVITPRVVFAEDELPITWSTSNPQVASVADGCVTALATGEVTITATCGTATASVDLTVYAPLESFSLSASELWLIAKAVGTVTICDIRPEEAIYSFTVGSSDTTVASVTLSGEVISIQALRPGDAVLTVMDEINGIEHECTIHVFYPVTAIDFAAQSVALVPGATAQLTATVTCRTQTVTNKLVTFATDDASVASVDENGLVTAIGLGSATITATAASGVSATCTVTVSDLQTSVLPADLVTIEANAFRATAVQCYILPEGVTTIGAQAFASCPNLIRVDIPASVTSIAADAFTGCEGLTIVAPEGSAAYQYAQTYGFAWAAP